jgi:hypothetical protein
MTDANTTRHGRCERVLSQKEGSPAEVVLEKLVIADRQTLILNEALALEAYPSFCGLRILEHAKSNLTVLV